MSCPEQCLNDCNDDGCGSCKEGYFLTQITSKNKLQTKVKVCEKCSDECRTCELDVNNCTSCPEYYHLEDRLCKFAYFKLVYIGMMVIILTLILMIYFIVKCICMEKPPERPTFGSILDKDPDL